MKLGYLRSPLPRQTAQLSALGKASDDRMPFAQRLGFSEFYVASGGSASGEDTSETTGPEQTQHLQVRHERPLRPMPKLVSVDGQTQPDHRPDPGDLVTPTDDADLVRQTATAGQMSLSASWLDVDGLARHWAAYVTGCTHAARRARPQDWRVARTVLLHSDPARAEAAAKDPDSPCRAYYRDHAPAGADDVAIDALIDDCVLYGTPQRVLERLNDMIQASAAFGTLAMLDHDWPDPSWARQSMTLFAGAVLPTYQAQMRRKTRKLEHA